MSSALTLGALDAQLRFHDSLLSLAFCVPSSNKFSMLSIYGTLVLPLMLCVRLFDRLSFSSRVSYVAAPSSLPLHHPMPLLLFFPDVIQWPPLLLFPAIIIGRHYFFIPLYHAWVYSLQFLRRPFILFLGTILDRPSFFSLASFIEWSNPN